MNKVSFLISFYLVLICTIIRAGPSNELNSAENFISGDQESLATVNGCVNVISGTFFQVDTDLTVDGPEPLRFTRCYDTGHLVHSIYGFGFASQFPLQIKSFWKGKEYYHAAIEMQEGCYVEFKGERNKDKIDFSVDKKILDLGLTNYSEFGMSAQTNLFNTTSNP